MIAGTTPKPHLRSRPTCHIPIIIRPDTYFLTWSPKSALFKIKTQWNGITCMHLTFPQVPPSKTIHDQLHPLPRSSSCAIIYAFSSKLAPMTIMRTDSVCLHRSLDERSRESCKTKEDKASSRFVNIIKVKVGKYPHNRYWGALAAKMHK